MAHFAKKNSFSPLFSSVISRKKREKIFILEIPHTNLKNTILRKTSTKFENGMNHCFDQPSAEAFRSCSSKTKLVTNKPFQKSLFNMFQIRNKQQKKIIFSKVTHRFTPLKGSSFSKIRPQAKIGNFVFKNSNIIIEWLI